MDRLREHLHDYKHVIWDWNGTLLDDVHLSVEVICSLLETHGLAPITVEAYRAKFRFPVVQYYEDLGFDFVAKPFARMADLFIESYNAKVKRCQLFPGAPELIGELNSRGTRQSILSAARESDLTELVRHYGLDIHLDHVCGLSDHYAAGKVERGRLMLQESGINPQDCVLVGDTEHDAEVAYALGIAAVVLADGHQDAERLSTLKTKVLPSRYLLSQPK